MKKLFLTCFPVLLFSLATSAQYADLGQGKLKNLIWWFDWSDFDIQENASKVFTTNDGLTVTIVIAKVSGAVPVPSTMNTWDGAVLHLLYDFSNPNIKPALYAEETFQNSKFTLTISAKRNGIATPFSFVAADAEASAQSEQIYLTTSAGNWKTIDFFKNSLQNVNPLEGCNTQSVKITDTYGNAVQTGQNPVVLTESGFQPLTIDVDFERSTLGRTGIAFGLFAPIDRGDLPASYGFAQHKVNFSYENSCNYGSPLPDLKLSEMLKIGTVA